MEAEIDGLVGEIEGTRRRLGGGAEGAEETARRRRPQRRNRRKRRRRVIAVAPPDADPPRRHWWRIVRRWQVLEQMRAGRRLRFRSTVSTDPIAPAVCLLLACINKNTTTWHF